MSDKLMASLDVKTLYTNIYVNNYLIRLKKHLIQSKIYLSLIIAKIIKICRLSANQSYFTFQNYFYKQKLGLPTGLPLSSLLAFIFSELSFPKHFT